MKPQKLCFSIFAALLISLSTLPAQAELVTLFYDNFAYAANSTNTPGLRWDTPPDGSGYSSLSYVYPAGGTVKLGTGTVIGSLTTTNLSMQAGSLHVQFDGVGWNSGEITLVISVAGKTATRYFTSLLGSPLETLSADIIIDSTGSYPVTFSTTTGDKRCFLDNILITQDVTVNESQPVFSVTGAPTSVEELTPISFTVGAMVGGKSTNVTCVTTLPTGASYVFENSLGEFNWTPALGQAGSYSFGFSAYGSDAQAYTSAVNITVTALPLTGPVNLAVNNVKDRTFDASWNPVAAATQGYVVDAWYGSSALDTPDADVETFSETTGSNPVQPLGWSFNGITIKYAPYAPIFNEMSLDTQGDSIITKRYPKVVTSLSFHLQGRSTATNADNIVTIFASTDGQTWTEIGNYSSLEDSDNDPTNNIAANNGKIADSFTVKTIPVAASNEYQMFKFVYTKRIGGNVGIGNIAAVYEGAGTKFISGWEGKTTVSTLESITGAKPGCIHYLRVGAKNATDTKYSTIRFQTLELPAPTLITVR